MALRLLIRRGGLGAACCAALLAWGGPLAGAAPPGTPILSPAELPHAAAPVHARHPFRPRDPAVYRAAKRQARSGLTAPLGAPDLAAPVQQAPGTSSSLNQPGLVAGDNAARNSGTPPDPTGAVGPSNYVEFVNSVVRVYGKDLTTVAGTAQLDTFVGATNDSVFDPQIQYDPVAGRWFYLAADCTIISCANHNFLVFGWSKTSDPSDLVNGWCRHSIRTDSGSNNFLDDYPKLGHDDSHLIFGTNVFNTTAFVSSRVWTVPKPPAGTLNCTEPVGTAHYFSGPAAAPVKDGDIASSPLLTTDGDPVQTPVPANTQDANTKGYVVAADDPGTGSGSQVMMWHVSGAPGSEALSADGNVNVSSYSVPANVPQPGSSDALDSSDTRLTQAVAHVDPDAGGAEAIWTQHTINGPGGRSQDRWYELIPGSSSPRQQGNIASSTSFVFNGAISPSMAGNDALIEYNVGGPAQLAQIRASSRASTRALGSMAGEVVLGTSTTADRDFSCPSGDPSAPSCRWGDYAAATPDPASTHLVWGTNQLIGPASGSSPHWTTRNFALAANAEASASFSAAPNPGFTGKPVSFDAASATSSGDGISDYAWDLDGDGTFETDTGTVDHVSRGYAQVGSVNVGLRVSAGASTSTASQTVTIKSSAPTAAFTAPATATRGTPVSFDASASSDAEAPGGIASYAWDFNGDGVTDQTTTSPTTAFTYTSLGSFSARLVVADSDDGQASPAAVQTVTVQNAPPVPRLTFSPAKPRPGQPVRFSAAGSRDPDGAVADYRWDLNGDGVFERDTGSVPRVSRRFAKVGSFRVGLQLRDVDGGTATTTVRVPVAKALKLVLTFQKSVRLDRLLGSGLSGRLSCGRTCTVKLKLQIPAGLAGATKLPRTVGTATVVARGSRVKRVRIRMTPKARRILRLAGPFNLTLTGSASDGAGSRSSARRGIAVTR